VTSTNWIILLHSVYYL